MANRSQLRLGYLFLGRVIRQASRDRLVINASSLAYHWFIALVPAAIAAISLTNLAGLPPARLRSLTHGISVLLPASAAKVFDQALTTRHSGSSNVTAVIIGGLVSFWASLEASATLQIALDMAYETSSDRGFIRRRIRGLLLVGITVLFGGGAFALLIVGESVGSLIEPSGSSSWFPILWTTLRWIVGIACVVALVSLYDFLGPNRTDKRWKLISIGGLASTLLWLAFAACYSFYLDHVGRASATYGTFSGVVALMLWLFFAGIAVLIGAEFNRELERSKSSR